MSTLIKKLDSVIDKIQDLHADAIEDGQDDAATKLEELLDAAKEITFGEADEETPIAD